MPNPSVTWYTSTWLSIYPIMPEVGSGTAGVLIGQRSDRRVLERSRAEQGWPISPAHLLECHWLIDGLYDTQHSFLEHTESRGTEGGSIMGRISHEPIANII